MDKNRDRQLNVWNSSKKYCLGKTSHMKAVDFPNLIIYIAFLELTTVPVSDQKINNFRGSKSTDCSFQTTRNWPEYWGSQF